MGLVMVFLDSIRERSAIFVFDSNMYIFVSDPKALSDFVYLCRIFENFSLCGIRKLSDLNLVLCEIGELVFVWDPKVPSELGMGLYEIQDYWRVRMCHVCMEIGKGEIRMGLLALSVRYFSHSHAFSTADNAQIQCNIQVL